MNPKPRCEGEGEGEECEECEEKEEKEENEERKGDNEP